MKRKFTVNYYLLNSTHAAQYQRRHLISTTLIFLYFDIVHNREKLKKPEVYRRYKKYVEHTSAYLEPSRTSELYWDGAALHFYIRDIFKHAS